MNTNPDFRQAITNVHAALRAGDRHLARQWAEHAASLAPNSEEAWLLLARLVSPQAAETYVRRGLTYNPNSAALRAELTRLTAAPAKGPVRGAAPKPKSRRGLLYAILLPLLACVVIVAAAISAPYFPAVASVLQSAGLTATPQAQFAYADIARPSITPSPTAMPLPSGTPLPSETPLPSVTPTDLPTATPGVMEAAIVEDTPTPERSYAQPSDAPSYSGDKYILVDISEQHMYVYEGNTLVYSFVASTGMNNATRVGLFHIQDKIPSAYGSTWNIWMPNWLGIYYAGGLENGIHALPILPNGSRLWAGFLGRPISYGCVVLGEYESELLYNWADVGTPVEIRW